MTSQEPSPLPLQVSLSYHINTPKSTFLHNTHIHPKLSTMGQLNRDLRMRIKILRDEANFSVRDISRRTGFSERQVRYTCQNNIALIPQKHKCGRPPKISRQRLDEVIVWMSASAARRNLSCDQVVAQLNLEICGETLRIALKQRRANPHAVAPRPLFQTKTAVDVLRRPLSAEAMNSTPEDV